MKATIAIKKYLGGPGETTMKISLSKPSKMPGYGWSTPASRCITGSKLRRIKGSVCHGCYAMKNRYVFP